MDPGEDSLGNVYPNIRDMWRRESSNRENWYSSANNYWSSQSADMFGVMGGLPEIHQPDISGSFKFLTKVNSLIPFEKLKALDAGCGIGRVSKHLLSNCFASIDLVDQCENYLNTARAELQGTNARFFNVGLQDFLPETGIYDCIWIQWVLSHLTDEDLLAFLSRISAGLKPGGVIIIKENIKKKGFFVHKDDFSVTRSEKILKGLLSQRLQIILEDLQPDFPENLFKVKMFACVPPRLSG